jgi:hypothetical protein
MRPWRAWRAWRAYRRELANVGYARQSPYTYELERRAARRAAGLPPRRTKREEAPNELSHP